MCRLLAMVLFLAVSVSPVLAASQGSDREQPIVVDADHCDGDMDKRESLCTGNVVVVQGTTQLQASKVWIRQDEEGNQYARGEGGPVRFQQQMEKDQTWVYAKALRFDYDGRQGVLKLQDQAWVKHGSDEGQGDTLVYYTREGRYEAPGKTGSRVYMVVQPK